MREYLVVAKLRMVFLGFALVPRLTACLNLKRSRTWYFNSQHEFAGNEGKICIRAC